VAAVGNVIRRGAARLFVLAAAASGADALAAQAKLRVPTVALRLSDPGRVGALLVDYAAELKQRQQGVAAAVAADTSGTTGPPTPMFTFTVELDSCGLFVHLPAIKSFDARDCVAG
jgi:hypothetical protein